MQDVKVNLNSLRDKPFAKNVELELAELEEKSIKRKDIIVKKMNNEIYPI